jgi:hypothetical protein
MTLITRTRYYDGETFSNFLARPTVNHELWLALAQRVMIPIEYSARVEALHGHWHLLVLSEDWCGDAVNIVPIVARLADSVSNMDMRILARDQNLDIMDAHLTNGRSRSIPIVILLNDKFQECGWWGPRPRALQQWVVDSGMQLPKDARYKEIRTFYARDRGVTTMREITEMLEECCVKAPSISSATAPASP